MNAVLLWLVLALPLATALAVRFSPRGAALAVPAAALAALPAWALLASAAAGGTTASTFEWLPSGGVGAGLQLDGLSAVMSATVATVGLVVMIHASGYFASEPRRRSALAGLLAFLGAMQGLVLADGYLTLLVFWELVGAASARLIAFSRDDPAAPPAAVRAFLTTRAADLGLYIALLALFTSTGSLDFASSRPEGAFGALAAIGLIVAAVGKSAQAPLQTWLSAAMAGPTPVSALLHSATMVAAGVYLLTRSAELLAGWPLEVVGWIGAVTAVLAAAFALAQDDLKRILAASTSSQLGLMLVGLAAGGPAVAIFQLVSHAAGKAGMFLAAGVFQHDRGTTSLQGLRGAGRDARPAFGGFVVGALSIAAVPPLAAFWSKEHIAAATEEANVLWFVLVLLATAGAAAYLLRPTLVLWRGRPTGSRERVGRRRMLAGVWAMAAGALALGAVGGPLERVLDAPPLPSSSLSLLLSLAALAAGVVAVLASLGIPRSVARALGAQLYTDVGLRLLVVAPTLKLSRGADWFERRAIGAAVDGIGSGTLVVARDADRFEHRGVDAAVDGLAERVERGGDALGRLQSGRLYEYLRDAVLGAAAIALLITLTALL